MLMFNLNCLSFPSSEILSHLILFLSIDQMYILAIRVSILSVQLIQGPLEDEQPILLSQEIMKGTEHQLHSTSLDVCAVDHQMPLTPQDDSVSRIIRASQPSISEDESEDRIKSKMETESDDIDMNGENEEKASNLSQEENSSEQVKIICFVPFHSLTNPFTS